MARCYAALFRSSNGQNPAEFKPDGALNRITARDICGIRPQDIEWIWIVEQNRKATPEEIKELCKHAPKR